MTTLPKLLTATAVSVPEVTAEPLRAIELDVPVPPQEQDNWCWCAVTLGIEKFFNATFSLTQCQTAARVLNVVDACNRPGDKDVDVMFGLDVALTSFGRLARMTGVLDFHQVQREIDNERPVGVRVLFEDSGVGHFTVIRGYRTWPAPMLAIIDPLYAVSEWSFHEFLHNYRGSGKWKQSFLTH